jgi:hypothetical protein
MDVYCLIDFDNMPIPLRTSGLAALANRLQVVLSRELSSFDDVHVRLYGGWYTASGLSNSGSVLTQEISRSFPVVKALGTQIIRRIHCEIASSLVENSGQLLGWTHRQRHGIRSRLFRKQPASCASQSSCAIDAVVAWSRGQCPIPGCTVKTWDAFTYGEQKLVDTLLCCDVLALSRRKPPPPVFVLSDDDDLLPALLMGAADGGTLWRCRMKANTNTFYDVILAQNSVRTINI